MFRPRIYTCVRQRHRGSYDTFATLLCSTSIYYFHQRRGGVPTCSLAIVETTWRGSSLVFHCILHVFRDLNGRMKHPLHESLVVLYVAFLQQEQEGGRKATTEHALATTSYKNSSRALRGTSAASCTSTHTQVQRHGTESRRDDNFWPKATHLCIGEVCIDRLSLPVGITLSQLGDLFAPSRRNGQWERTATNTLSVVYTAVLPYLLLSCSTRERGLHRKTLPNTKRSYPPLPVMFGGRSRFENVAHLVSIPGAVRVCGACFVNMYVVIMNASSAASTFSTNTNLLRDRDRQPPSRHPRSPLRSYVRTTQPRLGGGVRGQARGAGQGRAESLRREPPVPADDGGQVRRHRGDGVRWPLGHRPDDRDPQRCSPSGRVLPR